MRSQLLVALALAITVISACAQLTGDKKKSSGGSAGPSSGVDTSLGTPYTSSGTGTSRFSSRGAGGDGGDGSALGSGPQTGTDTGPDGGSNASNSGNNVDDGGSAGSGSGGSSGTTTTQRDITCLGGPAGVISIVVLEAEGDDCRDTANKNPCNNDPDCTSRLQILPCTCDAGYHLTDGGDCRRSNPSKPDALVFTGHCKRITP